MNLLFSGMALVGGVVACRRSISLGQHFADHLEGINDVVVEFVQIVQGVGPLSDAEHGIDEGSGALHVAKIGDHLFFRLVNVL